MKVICLTTRKIYNSIPEALEDKEIISPCYSNILGCCYGRVASAGKDLQGNRLKWCTLKEFIEHDFFPCEKAEQRNWIVCLTDGRLFSSNKEASLFYGIDKVRISMQLQGIRPSAGFNKDGDKLIFIRWEDFVKKVQELEETK